MLHLQRRIGNRAVQQMIDTKKQSVQQRAESELRARAGALLGQQAASPEQHAEDTVAPSEQQSNAEQHQSDPKPEAASQAPAPQEQSGEQSKQPVHTATPSAAEAAPAQASATGVVMTGGGDAHVQRVLNDQCPPPGPVFGNGDPLVITRLPDWMAQRTCACGGIADETGECEQCREKRLAIQRQAVAGAETTAAPSPVNRDFSAHGHGSNGQVADTTPPAVQRSHDLAAPPNSGLPGANGSYHREIGEQEAPGGTATELTTPVEATAQETEPATDKGPSEAASPLAVQALTTSSNGYDPAATMQRTARTGSPLTTPTLQRVVQRIGLSDLNPLNAAKKLAEAALGAIRSLGGAALSTAQDLGNAAVSTAKNVGSSAWNTAKSAGQGIWNTAKSAGTSALNLGKSLGTSAWNTAKSAGQGAWSTAKGLGQGAWDTAKQVGSAARSTVQSVGSKAWGTIKNVSGKALDTAKTLGGKAVDTATSLTQKFIETVKKDPCSYLNPIVGLRNLAFKALTPVVKKAWNTAKDLGGKAWKQAKQLGGSMLNTAKDWGGKALNTAKGAVNKAVSGAKNLGKQVLSTAKDLGGKALSGAKNAMTTALNTAKNLGTKALGTAKNLGQNVFNTAKNLGSNMLNTAKGAADKMLGLANNLTGGMAGKVAGMANQILGKAAGLLSFVMNIAKGLADKALGAAKSLTSKALSTAKDWGSKAFSTAKDLGSKALSTAKDWGGKALSTAKDWGGKALSTAKNLGSRAWSTAKDWGGKAWNTAKGLGSKALSTAKDWGGKALSTAKNWGGKVLDVAKKLGGEKVWNTAKSLGNKAWGIVKKAGPALEWVGGKVASGIQCALKAVGIAEQLTGLVNVITDFVPIVSNIKDGIIAITGINPVTGEKVSPMERAMAAAFAIPGAGNVLKLIGKGGKLAAKGVKYIDEGLAIVAGIVGPGIIKAINAIPDALRGAKSAADELLDNVWNGIKQKLGKGGKDINVPRSQHADAPHAPKQKLDADRQNGYNKRADTDAEKPFSDREMEERYQKYLEKKQKKGEAPRNREDYQKAYDFYNGENSAIARGNRFNRTANEDYDFHEIHLGNGKRLDAYIPGKEIVSRKAIDFDNVDESTFIKYLQEMEAKYKPGTPIKSTKYADDFQPGTVLEGEMFLEVPDTNLTSANLQKFTKLASERNIQLKFKKE
ncbi:MAG TPA: pre-toxin TG domain-containing protein [Herpetosiphonaceae bacterium]